MSLYFHCVELQVPIIMFVRSRCFQQYLRHMLSCHCKISLYCFTLFFLICGSSLWQLTDCGAVECSMYCRLIMPDKDEEMPGELLKVFPSNNLQMMFLSGAKGTQVGV